MSSPDAAAAGLALLHADTHLTVYDGLVPVDPATGKLPRRPYVVLWAPPVPEAFLDSLEGRSGWWEQILTTTVVGDNAESVRVVSRRVRDALLDVIPDVAGRTSIPIAMDGPPLPTQADQDVQPPVLFSVISWLCSSTTA